MLREGASSIEAGADFLFDVQGSVAKSTFAGVDRSKPTAALLAGACGVDCGNLER